MKDITTEEKIEYIEQTRSFGEIRQAWFPPSASTEYYFVSYCHADYKAVFRDLFGMQAVDPEFSVWYDRELIAGKDWKAEAQKHIYDFNCKGVIFYVSENSVKSPAVLEEIKMTRDAGKFFLPIVLPSSNGEYIPGEQLSEGDGSVCLDDPEALELYRVMFGKDITYLKLSDEPEHKVKAIRKSLRGEPLLRLALGKLYDQESCFAGLMAYEEAIEVLACNDLDVIVIEKRDFIPEDEILGELNKVIISDCAFTNCANLQSIELPPNTAAIGQYAFLNCMSLKSIVLPPTVEELGDFVFAKCYRLSEVVTSVPVISKYAFQECVSLKNVVLKQNIIGIEEGAFFDCVELESFDFGAIHWDKHPYYEIGMLAFRGCKKLKSAKLPFGLPRISEGVFDGCVSLAEVEIPQSVKEIREDAFFGCSSLKSIRLPKSIQLLEHNSFFGTTLTDIYYDGTVKEWRRIDFEDGWDDHTPDYIVHCSNGDIKK